ncbi:hypothetical protein M8C21_010979 [Ambrosia artemisiifolia]|uniref:Uncharacterized protein n=1 Tax=Ambrosia artemisiifolia TaxID=4212 RepID=A0AAD5CNZ5_AMBAR|nr:hypothetical protein M8C21_010979 [Ambrosia artemisiifolia]
MMKRFLTDRYDVYYWLCALAMKAVLSLSGQELFVHTASVAAMVEVIEAYNVLLQARQFPHGPNISCISFCSHGCVVFMF